ncbi:zinc-dependent metalloprotease [Sphingomicrobium nitratireducens]|uniref:zinc-dependent metalloprotease n=1 Tax=Sphingomicrobium nitratireducens TaxID=2964666 RepID=UPI002240D1A7|nr:zinc-dependent metalloprotease [Sphingomicrobium nitratireducens]
MKRLIGTAMMGAALVLATPAGAQDAPLMTLASKADSKLLFRFPAPGADGVVGRYIYVSQLESGLGSAQIVLDRGVTSDSRLLVLRKVGDRLVAEVQNSRFIASRGNEDEQRAIDRSFAKSVLWTGKIDKVRADGAFDIDLSAFFLRDDFGIARTLGDGGGGDFSLDKERSLVLADEVRIFPKNAEVSSLLTVVSDKPKPEIANIAPDHGTLSFRLRHSLIALPEPGYQPRLAPYGYSFGTQVVDASAPLGQPMVRDLMIRFRLEKEEPGAARSRVKKPIVFYVDPAAPEGVRQALIEGVGWWRDAFDAAGLIDAFRVELLPEGADPLDVRYNVVNWVNRATRGWSYGGVVFDPRTGELVKGLVQLGSLRVRQDIMIFQALVGAGLTGTGDPNDPIDAALARIRQLGAHEVGHALGFSHNFAASTQERYSVMDYPAPRVTLTEDGAFSLADAYGVGVGAWDKFLVDYAYGARTDAEAAPKVAAARAAGLRFVADPVARPLGAAHPEGGLWDDGAQPVAELQRVLAVRDAAVDRFSIAAVPAGASQAELRRAFVPIWLLHRYQAEAAAKQLGGVYVPTALAGEAARAQTVAGAAQHEALDVLLSALTPERLAVPADVLPYLSASEASYDRQRAIELIDTAGGPVFDPMAASEVAAMAVIAPLLAPDRLDRMEAQHAADASVPAPLEVVDRLIGAAFTGTRGNAAMRRVATVAVLALAKTARDPALSPSIAVAIDDRMHALGASLVGNAGSSEADSWGRGLGALLLDRERMDARLAMPGALPDLPPGSPIG